MGVFSREKKKQWGMLNGKEYKCILVFETFFLSVWWRLMATHLSGRQTWTPAICLRIKFLCFFSQNMYHNEKVWLRDKWLKIDSFEKVRNAESIVSSKLTKSIWKVRKIQVIWVTVWFFSILGSMISKAQYGQPTESEHYPAPDTWKSTQRKLENPNFWERTLKTNIRSSFSLLHFRVWHFSAAFLSSLLAGWNPVKNSEEWTWTRLGTEITFQTGCSSIVCLEKTFLRPCNWKKCPVIDVFQYMYNTYIKLLVLVQPSIIVMNTYWYNYLTNQ